MAMRVAMQAATAALVLAACSNNPYPADLVASNTLIYTFDERSPRYLDPVASYSNPESAYTYQIYEPPYGYHYLKRPYVLEPRAAAEVVKPVYLDSNGQKLSDDAPADGIAESVYDVPIRKGILYQPHPAFAKDAQGRYRYRTRARPTRPKKQRMLETRGLGEGVTCPEFTSPAVRVTDRAPRSPAGTRAGWAARRPRCRPKRRGPSLPRENALDRSDARSATARSARPGRARVFAHHACGPRRSRSRRRP